MPEPPREAAPPNPWSTGDEDAARQLFDRYADQLVLLARKRISQRLASRIDAEDIVQSVFRTFFHRAKQGQFHLEEPDDVCKLLARITVHKTFRQIAFHRRAKRDASQETAQGDDSQDMLLKLLAGEPTPEEAAAFVDQLEHFFASLTPEQRRILELRMEGYSNVEIAEQLGITDRKIRRIMERVRALAEKEGLTPEGHTSE
jgi:RNA polymerase sigma-70 factor (ECF subfamily)